MFVGESGNPSLPIPRFFGRWLAAQFFQAGIQARKERFASDLPSKLLKELELEAEILCICEQEIIASLKHYHRPDSFDDSSDEVMQAQLTAVVSIRRNGERCL